MVAKKKKKPSPKGTPDDSRGLKESDFHILPKLTEGQKENRILFFYYFGTFTSAKQQEELFCYRLNARALCW
jgi:hypothetical protein